MYFSDYFKVNRNKIKEYGAIDINLACDLPLFIDPMLIFNSEKLEYKKLHEQIIRYFHLERFLLLQIFLPCCNRL